MLPIKRALIEHPFTRPVLRGTGMYWLREVKAVVAHWTANTDRGADAMANRNYFNNGSPGIGGKLRAASAHYCVDDGAIVQCIPENEVAYHVGATHYKEAGNKLRAGTRLTPNYFCVGYEICVNSDGDLTKTMELSTQLAAMMLAKNGLCVSDLLRHYDVTGKGCPKMLIDERAWDEYKVKVLQASIDMGLQGATRYVVNTKGLNVRLGPSTNFPVMWALLKGEPVVNYQGRIIGNWVCIGEGEWVHGNYLHQV